MTILVILILLLHFFLGGGGGVEAEQAPLGAGRDSPVTCSDEGIACEAHGDTLLEIIPQIDTLKECRQLCQDNRDCQYLTHYGDASSPFHNDCFLFSSCEQTYSCEHCVSETRDCFSPHPTCSVNYTGLIEDNIVKYLLDIDSDSECASQCLTTDGCSFYTFYADLRECFLLDRIIKPLSKCDTCSTGSKDCADLNLACSMFVDGTFVTSMKLTQTTIANATLFGYEDCQFRYLLVGGGGMALGYGGAGSGNLKYKSVALTKVTNAQIRVGGTGEGSWLAFDGVTTEARPGQTTTNNDGGDGYSGGGEQGNPGGTNGGNGGGGHEGQGTGEDIGEYMTYFNLTPGAGGKVSSSYGGGGGGVLVDGTGPTNTDYQGEGYGGGGSKAESKYIGLPGVVLLETA